MNKIRTLISYDDLNIANNIEGYIKDLETIITNYKEADSWYDDTLIKEEVYNNLLDLMQYNDALENRYEFNKLVDNRFNG